MDRIFGTRFFAGILAMLVASPWAISQTPGKSTSTPSSAPKSLTVIGDTLYFSAEDGIHGRELWALGWNQLTRLVADIEPGPGSSCPDKFHNAGGHVLFTAMTSAQGYEPWLYDPTNDKARLLRDMVAGPASSTTVFPGNGQ